MGRNRASILADGRGPLDGTVDKKVVRRAFARECYDALRAAPALGVRSFTTSSGQRIELCERIRQGAMETYVTRNGVEVEIEDIPINDWHEWCIHAGRQPRGDRAGSVWQNILKNRVPT